jgi:hypothetical protein
MTHVTSVHADEDLILFIITAGTSLVKGNSKPVVIRCKAHPLTPLSEVERFASNYFVSIPTQIRSKSNLRCDEAEGMREDET